MASASQGESVGGRFVATGSTCAFLARLMSLVLSFGLLALRSNVV